MKEENGRKDRRKKEWLFLVVFFLSTILGMFLGVLCLREAQNAFVQARLILLSGLVCVSFIALCLFAVWAVLADKETLTKTLLSVFLLLLFSLFVCFLLQKTGFFRVVNSPEKLQAYLERAGIWMPLFYILLQFLQVVILPIPAFVSTLAGVALFGAFRASVYSMIGILLGSAVAFWIGRRLGNRAVVWIVGEDTLKKWQKKLKGKDNLILTLMFALPLFPDDILCFVAGLSSMSTKYFLTVIFLSRIFGIVTTCYSFDFIPFNTWWGLLAWGGIFAIVITAFVLVYKNMDKIQRKLKEKRK